MLKADHFEGGSNVQRGGANGKHLVELLPQSLTSAASAGGGATETLAVAGLKTTDELVAYSQVVKGASGTAPIAAAIGSADGQLDVEWTLDPGAGAVIKVLVLRDAK